MTRLGISFTEKVPEFSVLTVLQRPAGDVYLADAVVLNPRTSELCDRFAEQYAELRKKKGITVEQARETIHDVSYFGTMLVHNNLVDGMVSGATHTTAHTVRPAFEIIKTLPDVSTVSSIFLMCLSDRVLAYGDCAIVPDPTASRFPMRWR